MNEQKRIVIIAGPNGAGKTTFAQEFLPFEAGLPLFINADLIAAGLSPFQPDAVSTPLHDRHEKLPEDVPESRRLLAMDR